MQRWVWLFWALQRHLRHQVLWTNVQMLIRCPLSWFSISILPYSMSALQKVRSKVLSVHLHAGILTVPRTSNFLGTVSFLFSLPHLLRLRFTGWGGEQKAGDSSETPHKPMKSERLSKDWGMESENSPFNNNLSTFSPHVLLKWKERVQDDIRHFKICKIRSWCRPH